LLLPLVVGFRSCRSSSSSKLFPELVPSSFLAVSSVLSVCFASAIVVA
jgi:hypothetical protein